MKKTFFLLPPALVIFAAISVARGSAQTPDIPVGNKAPALVGGPWLNTKDGKPVTIESRKGKPTLVAFWTFACENCQNNLKPYERILALYRKKGVELISVHTPELKIEREQAEVQKHIAKYKIDYPVLVDNDGANWNRWQLSVWPTLFVLDKQGRVRYQWKGELNWQNGGGEAKIEQVLDALLAE